ncbi:hypothetical protein A3K63_04155 [Candidatus Micrarchaeota archaeon RBG_16_49_10]|nr:MAG: hypothetical protein A3K63_04155 [Candidatus Micrarchaeota archaeon RBG_16_49_10]
MIPDIDEFKEKLKELRAKVVFDYEFTDYYYVNDLEKPWNPSKKNLRIRVWKKPDPKCSVLFSELEILDVNGLKFKRSNLKEGKLCLYEGSFGECKRLLESLGFRQWFSVEKKDCTLYEIPGHKFRTVNEFIPNLGWTGELEVDGDNPEDAAEKLKRQMKILGFGLGDVTSDTVSMVYAKKNRLI